jgi:protein-S-isoprenylcysteine O-methyltransferase Ste14
MLGMEILRAHLPELRAGRGPLLAVAAALIFSAASGAMLLVDRFWPAWTWAGQLAGVLLGFVTAGQFFWRRRAYRARYGDLAYRTAVWRWIVPGLPIMFAAIFHTLYLPGERVLTGWLTPLAAMLGLYFLLTGVSLYVRAYLAFGVDNLAMLYVYFPDESRLINASIYALLRHPAYSGAIRMGLAFGLWRGTMFSVLFGLFMPFGLTLWLRWVEEPELVERFGAAYLEYRRSTPAFWPPLKHLGRFYTFLIKGS